MGQPSQLMRSRISKIFALFMAYKTPRSTGSKFTWIIGQVSCKLDHALINNEWRNMDLHCVANFLQPGFLSDHTPCVIDIHRLQPNSNGHGRPFKFYNMWASHPNYRAIVQAAWQPTTHGNYQFILANKLHSLKLPLRGLNKQHFSHNSTRARDANLELKN